jgi:four helix bundle protein
MTENSFSFQDLQVWQKAVAFAEKVIRQIDELEAPRKHFRLLEQLEAASTSISMNIAEGKGRFSKKEFLHFLYVARGSLYEVITLLIILKRLNWIGGDQYKKIEQDGEEIAKMLNSLIKSVKDKLVAHSS